MILQINTQIATPIYEQLCSQIVIGIATGQLVSGESLPSVRRLAADLGINMHTVNKAYNILCEEGYLIMSRRRGAIVADTIKGEEGFKRKLMEKITIIAAEARCHSISLEEFLKLCENGFKTNNKEDKNE